MGAFKEWVEKTVLAPAHEKYDLLIEAISNISFKLPEELPLFTAVQDWITEAIKSYNNWRTANFIERLRDSQTVQAVDLFYNNMPEAFKEDAAIKQFYDYRKDELTKQGMLTATDFAAGFVGTQMANAIWLVTNKAKPYVLEWLDTFGEAYNLRTEELDAMKKLAGSGEFGLNAIVSFMLGVTLYPTIGAYMQPKIDHITQSAYASDPAKIVAENFLIPLMYRFPENKDLYVAILKRNGYDDDQIKIFMDSYLFYPSAQDLVTWQAREVFEVDAIEKYGLMAEFENLDLSGFSKAGINEEQAGNYWKAHWQHPAWRAIIEMAHRGLLTGKGDLPAPPATREEWLERDAAAQKEVYEWFRLVEVPPYWRDKMFSTIFKPLTRVDVRRMWDLRVIDRQTVYNTYRQLGYNDEAAEQMTLFTIVYELANDLKARYSKGWLGIEEVRTLIAGTGMPSERVEEWVQMVVSAGKGERLAKEKDLTKAEIVKGVKKEVITIEEGKDLLLDLGYDEWEAAFILAIEIEAMTGSPHTYLEFKQLTTLKKKATGDKCKLIPPKLLELEKEYIADPNDTVIATRYREELKKWREECKNEP